MSALTHKPVEGGCEGERHRITNFSFSLGMFLLSVCVNYTHSNDYTCMYLCFSAGSAGDKYHWYMDSLSEGHLFKEETSFSTDFK